MSEGVCLSMEEIAAMGDAIAETAAIIDVATHRFLTQLREFDRVDGWHRAGALSCAHWLSWRVGMDFGAAREKVRSRGGWSSCRSSTGRWRAERSRTRRCGR
jgi:hypothetical protein